MYVAITRARERLYLTRSKSRYLYGKREPTMRSRFLKELSSELELPREPVSALCTAVRTTDISPTTIPRPTAIPLTAGGRYSGGTRTTSYGARTASYGDRQNSAPKRSAWNGGAYGGSTMSGSSSATAAVLTASSARDGSSQKSTGAFTYGGVGSGAAKPKAGGKDLSAFKTGVKVSHPKFGDGDDRGRARRGREHDFGHRFFGAGHQTAVRLARAPHGTRTA